MNLHRSGPEGQWASVAPEDRNSAQNIAAITNGLITPGNAVSLLGAGLVASGLKDVYEGKTTKGIVKLGVGRGADVLDGTAAEATGTKSPVGEAVDVVVDKLETVAAIPILVKAGLLPITAAGVITGVNAGNSVFSAVAKRRGAEIHPSKEGKLGTAFQWGTIGFYGLSGAAEQAGYKKAARRLELAGHATTVAMAALGAKAVFGYAQDALGPTSKKV